jgi:hypothetical protein
MAFNVAAAGAAGAPTELLNIFQQAGPGVVAARDQFPRLVVPRNGTDRKNHVINMFIDGGEGMEYAASIVNACDGKTTMALRCTSATDFAEGCSSDGPVSFNTR